MEGKQGSFRKMPLEAIHSVPEHRLFEIVAKHVQAQVEREPYTPSLDLVVGIPIEAQVIYWLWRFTSEAEGGGIERYLLDDEAAHVIHVHDALRQIGAAELLRRFEAGIPLALLGPAEFKRAGEQGWFRQFAVDPSFPNLQSVDIGNYPDRYDALRVACHRFISDHKDVFFDM